MGSNRIIRIFTSLRLTVVCLAFAILLVLFGTLSQVNDGLYLAQARWFRSFIVWWGPHGASWEFPIFPGGYLIGFVLLANLIAAHLARFKLTWSKLGIHLTHGGVILLLLGQLATDMLSRESHIHFAEGDVRNYSESSRYNELVFMTPSRDGKSDETISIPQSMLKPGEVMRAPGFPVAIRVKEYYPNALVRQRAPMIDTNAPLSTNGIGPKVTLVPMAESRDLDDPNVPSAIIELFTEQQSSGDWIVSPDVSDQEIGMISGKDWRCALRPVRYYTPYSLKLLKTTWDIYQGTEIPKNFQSRVRIDNPASGEDREVNIYMNNPLRYRGLTYYQSQMGREELQADPVSTLMVVKNPGWLTPYAGCIMVAAGMVVQFLSHLLGFISKRRTA